MKTQQSIKDGVQNLVNNQGIFVQEKDIDFEGQVLKAILVIPQNLASRGEEILEEVIPSREDEDEDEDIEDFEDDGADDEADADKKKPNKKATKKATKKGKK